MGTKHTVLQVLRDISDYFVFILFLFVLLLFQVSGCLLRICWIILQYQHNKQWGGVVDVPQSVLEAFKVKETYITHGETMGPLLALYFNEDAFKNSLSMFFIDNMGALSASVCGHSTAEDVATIAYTTQLFLARLRCAGWFEHVDSDANIADGGSRTGCMDLMASELNIPLTHHDWPTTTNGLPIMITQMMSPDQV